MTPRQNQILNTIIETYAVSAEPVSSAILSKQFNYSPATIRSEMANLEKMGLITHTHTSAGRIPTDRGYRVYVNSAKSLSAEDRIKNAVAKKIVSAGDGTKAIKAATEVLSDLTRNLSWATLADNFYLSGMAALFSQPEFASANSAFEVARLLDSLDQWLEEASLGEKVNIYIGHENPIGRASNCTLIISRFSSPYSTDSYIGILGPTRQSYRQVIDLVDYTGRLLEEELNER